MKRIVTYIFLWNVLSVSILNARPADHIHVLYEHCYLNLEEEEKDSAGKLKEILDGFDFPADVLHDFYIQLQKIFPETTDVEELLGFMSELPGNARGIFVQNPELLDIYKKFKDTEEWELSDFKEALSKKLFDAPDEFFENFKDVFTNKLGDGTIEVKERIEKFISDLKNDSGEKFTKFIKENGSGVRAWEKLIETADPGIKALRTDV